MAISDLTDQELETILEAVSPEAQLVVGAISRVMLEQDIDDKVGAEALAVLLATIPEDLGMLLHKHLLRLAEVRTQAKSGV